MAQRFQIPIYLHLPFRQQAQNNVLFDALIFNLPTIPEIVV